MNQHLRMFLTVLPMILLSACSIEGSISSMFNPSKTSEVLDVKRDVVSGVQQQAVTASGYKVESSIHYQAATPTDTGSGYKIKTTVQGVLWE